MRCMLSTPFMPRRKQRRRRSMCLAIPGKVIAIDESDAILRMGKVSFGGAIRDVALSTAPEAAIGSYVLVHAGIAISKVDEAEAQRVLESIAQLDLPDEDGFGETTGDSPEIGRQS